MSILFILSLLLMGFGVWFHNKKCDDKHIFIGGAVAACGAILLMVTTGFALAH